ncbi:phosphatase PAP2 family protein [Ferruginibacter sp.]|uniref:phosphatase PAP2 family protein n=1 Tax=Ferruginibacter sp. TaxID=1940288 RepID=UPI0019A8EB05|nr:phosphatase PAP2 family protein [Ferruginibacter sp.]MBC7627713.1 phosphatase PAP2 family protein [Ferruginibacter sp.]
MKKRSNICLRIKNFFEEVSLSLVLLIFIFVVCMLCLYAVADMVFEDNNPSFDRHVFTSILPYINAANTGMMQVITFFGSAQFLIPANILLILFVLFIKKQQYDALKISAITIIGTAVLFLLKFLLQRQRPLLPLIAKAHGYSFPSGHSFSSIVFYGMLAYIGYKNIKNNFIKWSLIVLLFMLAGMVGFSRIYLKLHYASDVIAGFSLGIIWLLLAKWILFGKVKIPAE